MEEEAARNTPFALALGDMLPRLSIHTLEATALGEDTHHVNLVVENTGFLPSYTSRQGKKPVTAYVDKQVHKQLRSLGVELEKSNQEMITEALNDYFKRYGLSIKA